MILFSNGLVSYQPVTDEPFVIEPTSVSRYEFTSTGNKPLAIVKFKNGKARERLVPFSEVSDETQTIVRTAFTQWRCAAIRRHALSGTTITLANKNDVAAQSLLVLQRLHDNHLTRCAPKNGETEKNVLETILDLLPVNQESVSMRTHEHGCSAVPPGAKLTSSTENLNTYRDYNRVYKVYRSERLFKEALEKFSKSKKKNSKLVEAAVCFQSSENQYVLTVMK